MTETQTVRFEEAEEKKWKILLYTAICLTGLAWLCRSSGLSVALVTGLGIYLMTGDRYQWIYIFRKTFYRDLHGLTVLVKTTTRMRLWEKQGTTVVTRWAEVCQRSPDKKAFVMDDRFITFQDGDHLSNRIAWYFKRQGFKRGDVIALFMETQPEYTFLWLGLAKIGVISALVNSNLRGSQLTHCLRVAKCKALIFGDEMCSAIKDIRSDLKDMPMFQYGSENVPNVHLAVALTSEIKDMPTENINEDFGVKPRDTLLYIYTSGTTGFPKAAVITNIRYLLIPSGVYASAGLNSSDVIYDPLPLHHTAGGVLGAGQALIFGCTVVLRKKFSASNYWSDAAKYGCTVAQYIGEICRYVLSVPPSSSDTNHKVRVILGNGLRPQIWEKFTERFNIPRVLEFYGATEGNSNLINLDSKVGAIGFLSRMASSIYPLTLVKCDEITGEIFRDKNGRCIVCGPFEPGLFLGKIDSRKAILTFSGYADRTASEKKMVRDVRVLGDCYFNTGDILVMDHFGYFYFKDRTGDTFRWKGENVSTAEVEGLLSNIVGLKDTIVYGVKVPHVEGKAGMVSIADPDNQLDLEALSKALKSLPVYSRPLFLRILPEPPITATFKLKKKELIEQNYDRSVTDPLYLLDPKSGRYVRLTDELYQSIVNGDIKL